MAIVQISRIQHRRGISTDLPQLASAEFGWSVDTRQLYIGNGTIEEGAPTIGNTEILTEYSDLLSIAQTYTFKGQLAGYVVQTGSSINNQVTRSLQDKLDDFVNIRDFGAVGDGNADDTAAINRAMYQIYCLALSQPLVRRTIYFPAGNYKITGDVVRIPTYASLRGEGIGKTFITQVDPTQDCVVKLADSMQQVDTMIGTNGAIPPENITVYGISFVNETLKDVSWIRTAQDVIFDNVEFVGAVTDFSSPAVGSSRTAVYIYTDGSLESKNILFKSCMMSGAVYGLNASDVGIKNIMISESKFTDLHIGVKLGEGSITPPNSVRVLNNYFDNIYSSAINTYGATNIISAYNYYANVGNAMLGIGFPNDPVLVFGSGSCYSFADTFDRTDADDGQIPRIDQGSNTSVTVIPHLGIGLGMRKIGTANTILIPNNATETMTLGFDSATPMLRIVYSAVRGTGSRSGILRISGNGIAVSYDDDYTETTPLGLTLRPFTTSGEILLEYSTTNGLAPVNFTYSIDYYSV